MSNVQFEYRVRHSARARHVRLRVTLTHGLEIVVPAGMVIADVPAMLAQRSDWIRAALARCEDERERFAEERRWQLPTQIVLPAIDAVWELRARVTAARGARVRTIASDQLEISGAITDERACRVALARWLVGQAHQHLVPRLQALSQRFELHYRTVTIRRQKTRWGSCSRAKAISLNANLLFLPRDTADCVLVHELCHLAHFNHSSRFWRLVERHCPDYRRHEIFLREMRYSVPAWAR